MAATWSLRGSLKQLSFVLTTVGVLALALVVIAARALSHSDHELSMAIESVRSVQQIEVSLLAHARAHGEGNATEEERARSAIQLELRKTPSFVTSADE